MTALTIFSSICLFALMFIGSLKGQSNTKSSKFFSSNCVSKETCGQCVELAQNCAWCLEDDAILKSKGITKRCDDYANLAKCNPTYLFHPDHTKTTITDQELSNKGVEGEPIQLKPQHVRLKLRPNSPYLLDVQFRQAKDYPLDLYYLMDLSYSMRDDKESLSNLGKLLAQTMVNLTSEFKLGFGSFVDKKVMPFVSTVPEKLRHPCDNKELTCAPSYGFHNQMPLNSNTDLFSEKVSKSPISGNLDTPEGGFDAIMQATVCKLEIGWRQKARKIIVFSTDAAFHQAGDGLLGGIIKPNDEQCHIDSNGFYTESIYQDYPSISQLNRKLRENSINVIFAVTDQNLPLYEQLTKLLEGSSFGALDDKSSNVVNFVRNQYNKITSEVKLKHNAPEDVNIRYFTTCLDGNQVENNTCEGLQIGKTVSFQVEISVKSCPKNRDDWSKTIQIYPVGLNENIIVDVELICECDCEKSENEERNSPICSSGNGTYECGICSCNEKRYGRLCECDLTESQSTQKEDSCVKPGGSAIPCSGRGVCRCGVCECTTRSNSDEQISGEFCECDNFSCERTLDGKLCGGSDRGKCECGVCSCNSGWTGSSCDCRSGNSTCIGPDKQLCSGHGTCECGECRKCQDSDGQRRSGLFCEECPTCPKQCDFYKDCVQCLMFQTGKYKDPTECEKRCENIVDYLVKTDKVEVVKDDKGKLCLHKDESDACLFSFKYLHAEGQNPVIVAQITKDCPKGPNVLAIVLGVTGGIVLIGAILLLIWKVFTTIHDKKEWAEFERERKKALWNKDENPLYKPSTSEFKNPTFDNA